MITESQEMFQEIEQMGELTDEHRQLLKILYSKDLDMEEAQYYLKKTKEQIEDMIHELVDANYLLYVSDNMVSITKKGVNLLLSSEEKKLDEKNQK
jgi:helix-turn-helix protein